VSMPSDASPSRSWRSGPSSPERASPGAQRRCAQVRRGRPVRRRDPAEDTCEGLRAVRPIVSPRRAGYSEFEGLRRGGIRHAELWGYSFDRRDVSARQLANVYAQTLSAIFAQELKPYEVEICVAESVRRPSRTRCSG